MNTEVPRASLSDWTKSKATFAILDSATYDDIAKAIAEYPRPQDLRVTGEFIPEPLSGPEFLQRWRDSQ